MLATKTKFNIERIHLNLENNETLLLLLKTQIALLRYDRNAVLREWRAKEDKQSKIS